MRYLLFFLLSFNLFANEEMITLDSSNDCSNIKKHYQKEFKIQDTTLDLRSAKFDEAFFANLKKEDKSCELIFSIYPKNNDKRTCFGFATVMLKDDDQKCAFGDKTYTYSIFDEKICFCKTPQIKHCKCFK